MAGSTDQVPSREPAGSPGWTDAPTRGVGSALGALASFQLRQFSYLLSGQKIDGTQTFL